MPYLSSTDSQPLDCHTQKLHTISLKKTFILLKQYMEVETSETYFDIRTANAVFKYIYTGWKVVPRYKIESGMNRYHK